VSNVIPLSISLSSPSVAIQQVASSWSTTDDPCDGWIVGYRDHDGWAQGKTITETDTFAAALAWARSFSVFGRLPIVEVDANGTIICVIDIKAESMEA